MRKSQNWTLHDVMLLGLKVLLLIYEMRAILCSKGLPVVYFEVIFYIIGYLPRLWQTGKTALHVVGVLQLKFFRPHRCFLFPHVVAVSHCLIRPSNTFFRSTTKVVVHSRLFCPVHYCRHLWFMLRVCKVIIPISVVSSYQQNKQNSWYKRMARSEWLLSLTEILIQQ